MTKSTRQSKILDIITNFDIDTQEELVSKLRQAGFDVTQATISRDIKELKLVKTLKNDIYVYAQLTEKNDSLSVKMRNLFRETVLSIDVANNLVLVKTSPNCATSAMSVVNELKIPQAMGVLSSFDTILVVTKDNFDADVVLKTLQSILN